MPYSLPFTDPLSINALKTVLLFPLVYFKSIKQYRLIGFVQTSSKNLLCFASIWSCLLVFAISESNLVRIAKTKTNLKTMWFEIRHMSGALCPRIANLVTFTLY